jgi:hypothetical protein
MSWVGCRGDDCIATGVCFLLLFFSKRCVDLLGAMSFAEMIPQTFRACKDAVYILIPYVVWSFEEVRKLTRTVIFVNNFPLIIDAILRPMLMRIAELGYTCVSLSGNSGKKRTGSPSIPPQNVTINHGDDIFDGTSLSPAASR